MYIGDVAAIGALLLFVWFVAFYRWSDRTTETLGYFLGTPEEIERTKRNFSSSVTLLSPVGCFLGLLVLVVIVVILIP